MKMKNLLIGLVFGVVLAWTTGLQAQGQITALQGWSDGISFNWGAETGYTFGWQFQVNQNIEVNSLGVDDLGAIDGSGSSTSRQVAIWTDAGILLASAAVTLSSQASGTFVWVALGSPLVLSVGTYRIGAYYPGPATDTFIYQATSVTTAPEITYLDSAASGSAGLSFPSYTGWYANSFFGPNFQYTTVPEPSVLVLAGLGGLALVAWRRQRGPNGR
jgi:hypothetical protein